MKKIFSILFILTFLSICLASEADEKINAFTDELFKSDKLDTAGVIAVIPFTTKNMLAAEGNIGIGIAEIIVLQILMRNYMKLVERMEMQKVLEEIALSQTGLMNDQNVIEGGNFLSADYILTGTVTSTMGKYVVQGRIINTKTLEVISSSKTTLDILGTSNVMEDLFSEKKYAVNSVFRSMLIPGWGQVFANRPVNGVASGLLCAGGIAASIITGINQSKAWDDYEVYSSYLKSAEYATDLSEYMTQEQVDNITASEHFYGIKDSKYDTYQGKRRGFVIAAAVTGGLWAFNIVDAFIAGKREQGRVKLYFSVTPEDEKEVGFAFNF